MAKTPRNKNKSPLQLKEEKEQFLKNNDDIRRWYANLSQGKTVTADVYLRNLRGFCTIVGKKPLDLLSMNEKDLHDTIIEFVESESSRGTAGSFIYDRVKSVKSWLQHNGIIITRNIKIRDAKRAKNVEDEQIPTQEELKKIISCSSLKNRVSCILVSHCGVRIEVLGNYTGDDGLRIKDFPEMHIDGNVITFDIIPTIVVVRSELSKNRKKYFTFLSSEGCRYLQEYLEFRLLQGEKLTKESDVIAPLVKERINNEMKKKEKCKFIRTTNISRGIKKSFLAAGINKRPYVLRSFFATNLLLAESKRLITAQYREFLMGHSGNISATYTVNKQLPEEMVEDMRESYRASQEFLQTTPTESNKDDVKQTIKREMLLAEGFDEEEIESLDLNRGFLELLDELRANGEKPVESGKKHQKQEIIDIKEIGTYLKEGYVYVTTLPGNKAIVELTL